MPRRYRLRCDEPKEKAAMSSPVRRRSPALNALILAGIIGAFLLGGAIIWNAWSRGSVTAVEEAHQAAVQPAETPPPRPAVAAEPREAPAK